MGIASQFGSYFGARHWRYDEDADITRAAYEGGAILDFFVSEDNFLNLSAVGSFDDHHRIQ